METLDISVPLKADQLEFREITSPLGGELVRALSAKERVHPADEATIEKNRLAPQNSGSNIWDKHCYGLFAPGSNTPEAAVYVKFMKRRMNENGRVENEKLTGNILMILNEAGKPISPENAPNTAIFYTITNMGTAKIERGSNGHTVGEELINRVAAHVDEKYHIPVLSTLSPLRSGIGADAKGVAQWIEQCLANGEALLTAAEQQRLNEIASLLPGEAVATSYEAIRHAHQHFQQLPTKDQAFFSQLMCDLGVHYLAEAKTPPRKTGDAATAFDPVEHFHLSNGAQFAHIHYHPPGNTTESESIGALGLMANYRYEPDMLRSRKQSYKQGEIVMDEALAKRHLQRMQSLKTPGIASIVVSLQQTLGGNPSGISTARQ